MSKFINFLNRIEWSNISKDTYLRYILMILVILNTVLTRLGLNPIKASAEEIYQGLSDLMTIVILLMNTWKNNSVTTEAIQADAVYEDLRLKDKCSK